MLRPIFVAVWMLAEVAEARAQSGWTQLSPSASPGPRYYHAMVYDFARITTVLHGGYRSGWGYLDDTWEWDGSNWTLRSPSASPPARMSPGFAYDLLRGRVVLFGGYSQSVPVGDTWEYDGVTWTQILTTQAPSPRHWAGMAYDVARQGVILFGGKEGSSFVTNDTWLWTGSSWTQLQPANAPPARMGHGMVTDFVRGRIVLHGGADSMWTPAPFQDTWVWNGNNWSSAPTTAQPPAVSRMGMTFDWTRGAPVLFGGHAGSGLGTSETWLFTGDTWVMDPSPPVPPARSANMLAFDVLRSRTVMFGGWEPHSTLPHGDTWEYAAPALASWTTLGTGCAGSSGVPLLRPVANARPVLGTTFPLEVIDLPTNALASIAIGFSSTTWSGGALPASLAPLGMPGCTLFVNPEIPFTTQATAGRATLSWPLPNVAVFAGITFFAQGIALDPGTNALGAVVSNAGTGVIGTL